MNPQYGYDHWGKLSEGKRPVCHGGEWFYVDEARNRLTNGTVWNYAGPFYNGSAVVRDDSGEYHIDASIQAIYHQRWAYAGPFLGEPLQALVRDSHGEEFHIFLDGSRAPAEPPPPWQW